MGAMPDKINASKVLCYIVRDGQLLVFRHVDYDLEHVGIQVPAGSIRKDSLRVSRSYSERRASQSLWKLSPVMVLPCLPNLAQLRRLLNSAAVERPSAIRCVGGPYSICGIACQSAVVILSDLTRPARVRIGGVSRPRWQICAEHELRAG